MHDISTHLATSTPEGMAELRRKFADAFGAGLSGAEMAVCYEESTNSGFGQSCRGYLLLSWLGYEKAKVLHGGMQAWKAAGLPVGTDPAQPAAKAFPLSEAGSGMVIDRDAMLATVGNDGIVKLDVHDVDERIGTSSSPTARTSARARAASPGRVGWNGIAW